MSSLKVLLPLIGITLATVLIGCGGQQAPPHPTDTPQPPASPTQKQPTPTPEPTPTAAVTTVVLQNVQLLYDIEDTRGFMVGFEEATIAVNSLPVVTAGGVRLEIPLADIAGITMQPSKRPHPDVEHWDISFLDATVTLRNQETIRCEIGSYLPLPSSGDKPAAELYNTTNIKDVYLTGEMADTGLATKVSLYVVQAVSAEAPGDSLDSHGTVRLSIRANEGTK